MFSLNYSIWKYIYLFDYSTVTTITLLLLLHYSKNKINTGNIEWVVINGFSLKKNIYTIVWVIQKTRFYSFFIFNFHGGHNRSGAREYLG